jgi:hypothetical protein
MDVIGFLCISLGSSTGQLHDSPGIRRACACSEAGFSSEMATVLRNVLPKSDVLLCIFCGQKDSMQRMLIKKCFLFTVGSVCRVKRFITGWQMFRWWRKAWNGGAEAAETAVKRLLCCGFRPTGKAVGQVYQCWCRICREINVCSGFEYHVFYVLHPFVIYLLTLQRKFYDTYLLCDPPSFWRCMEDELQLPDSVVFPRGSLQWYQLSTAMYGNPIILGLRLV